MSWGVDPQAIIVEERSRNTHENAALSAPLLAAKTQIRSFCWWGFSASHMPRALATFHKAGIAAEPATTDYGGGDLPPFPLSILPDASSLDATTRAFREWVGSILPLAGLGVSTLQIPDADRPRAVLSVARHGGIAPGTDHSHGSPGPRTSSPTPPASSGRNPQGDLRLAGWGHPARRQPVMCRGDRIAWCKRWPPADG